MRNAPKGVENGGRGGENFYWAAGGHFLLPPEVTEQIAKVKCFKVVPGGWSRGSVLGLRLELIKQAEN